MLQRSGPKGESPIGRVTAPRPRPASPEDILSAIERDELRYYFQPKVSLVNGRVIGAEALLRWVRPGRPTVMPDQIIPVAEREGLLPTITRHMFDRLLARLPEIHRLRPDHSISINAGAQDFQTPELVHHIRQAVARGRIDPGLLEVELTESALLRSDAQVRRNVQALVDTDVCLAMDDYATGYSSIDTLSQWPFSVLKLDKDIVRRANDSEKSQRIVEASIQMAHSLGVEMVAEGVESGRIFHFLATNGCTNAQGFWLARPMPLADYLDFLASEQRWSGLPRGLLYMAQIDHIRWRKGIIEASLRPAKGTPENAEAPSRIPELDHQRCDLGRWYYGAGRQFEGLRAFTELGRSHERLHELGQRLMAMSAPGARRDERLRLIQELTQTSLQVLALLQDLENTALAQPEPWPARPVDGPRPTTLI